MTVPQTVLMPALAVALQAKSGTVDQLDVDGLLCRAQQELADDHPMFRAIAHFAVQLELRPDPAALFALGSELHDRVAVFSMPTPPDANRRDIHG